ncbi:MAG TPA: M48 family metallopeptidase [Vicinamibacterales bacterium]|jgi:peptidase M48-like protein|nr:M48 family metallopeptidase [Vicinamibacterales bacterium]
MRAPRTHAAILAVVLSATMVSAQTKITAPKNKYDPKDDVKLGREAAAEVEQQMPLLRDDNVTSYVSDIGHRLAGAIPAELQHPEFNYTFKVVNVKEINAFALPGGPMYVNRGMIEAAKNEGEVAGVIAHELSHVALRHGTAQATKATPYEVGTIAGAILGAIVGGNAGTLIAQGTQFGLGTAFLRYSREYEKQADLEGSQIMARAGYDPRDMANMFKTIEQQGGSGGPQWLSDHPNPGNRYAYITKEAESLRVVNARHDSGGFQSVQGRLRQMSPAPSTKEATRNAGNTRGGGAPSNGGRISTNVERPSSRYSSYNEGNLFRISVPSNWRELPANNSVTFAPEGGYGAVNQQSVFTHGVEAGVARNDSRDLQSASEELVQDLSQSNPRMRRDGGWDRGTVGGRRGLRTMLTNQNDVTGRQERIALYTTTLDDGTLFYLIGVAPDQEFGAYDDVFDRVAGSLQFASSRRP